MSTKSKIAIALFILQIISTAGIVIGTSKDYLGALASAIGLSIFMIIAAVLVLVDNKKMYDKIKESKKESCSIETKNDIKGKKETERNFLIKIDDEFNLSDFFKNH